MQHSCIPLSQHKPRERKYDSEPEVFPLLLAGEADFPCAWAVAGSEEHLPGSHLSARFCADQVILNTFLVGIQEASVMALQKTRQILPS